MSKIISYTTCNGHFVLLENIDCVGEEYCNTWTGQNSYSILFKSGNKIKISSHWSSEISECRTKLIKLLELFQTT